jgi:TDG/mug DNA glycosylase family protein
MSVVLPDVLEPGLRVVFCGTAVGAQSAAAGAYYAGPGNQFWPVLHETGLTSRRLEPPEYRQLLRFGIGLTDVCKTRSGSDKAVGHAGFDVAGLLATLEEFNPGTVAFNGKKAAQIVLGHPVSYGQQHDH